MPAGDRTGPRGMGPMTGRAAGYCGGYDAPGWTSPVPGRGIGLGRRGTWGSLGGRGSGWRHRNWYCAMDIPGWARAGSGPAWGAPHAWAYDPYPPAPGGEQETEFLRQEAEWLKQRLDAIGQRIEELEQKE